MTKLSLSHSELLIATEEERALGKVERVGGGSDKVTPDCILASQFSFLKKGKREEERNQFQGFKDFVLRTWAQKYNVSIISSTYHRNGMN